MKTSLFLLSICALFTMKCGIVEPRKPIYSQSTDNNKDYKVEYLFEHDGCKVYRFMDLGNWVYFTNCRGETSVQVDSATVIRNSTNHKH